MSVRVLNLAYHTGMLVNIDLKNGYEIAEAVAKLVLKCGLIGKVVYALNGSGMEGINAILAIDSDARFIDRGVSFSHVVKDFAERGKRCFCYTWDSCKDEIEAVRTNGCLLALISLDERNFASAMKYHPDMCEFLHTSDFHAIEETYISGIRLY